MINLNLNEVGDTQLNFIKKDTITSELYSLISEARKEISEKQQLPSQENFNNIKALFEKIIKKSFVTINGVIAELTDNQRLISFDNIDNDISEDNSILFLQIFLESPVKRLNVLSDPYILIEGDPLLGEIQMYASSEDGRTDIQKLHLTDDNLGEKLFQMFFQLLKAFISTNIKSSELAYAP